MIADEIMEAAGVPFCYGGWYPKPAPAKPYAVVLDEASSRGADLKNLIEGHSVTIEVYTPKAYDAAADSVAAALDAASVPNDRAEPVWIGEVKAYMTAFYYEVTIKKGR